MTQVQKLKMAIVKIKGLQEFDSVGLFETDISTAATLIEEVVEDFYNPPLLG